jgi:hypothetical protein
MTSGAVHDQRPALKACHRRAGGILKAVPAPVCVRGSQRAGGWNRNCFVS